MRVRSHRDVAARAAAGRRRLPPPAAPDPSPLARLPGSDLAPGLRRTARLRPPAPKRPLSPRHPAGTVTAPGRPGAADPQTRSGKARAAADPSGGSPPGASGGDEGAPRRRLRIDPRIRQRRIQVKRQEGRRRLRFLIGATSLPVMALLGLVVVRSPLLAVRHVQVLGTHHLSAADVVGVAGLSTRTPMADVAASSIDRRLAALPWVARAVVEREWPTTVRITVTEREAVATLGPDLVDGDGWVVSTGPAPAHLPAVAAGPSSLVAPAVGQRVAPSLAAALHVAAALPASLAPAVQTITDTGGVITLSLASGGAAVLGAPTDLREKLRAVLTLEERAGVGRGTIDVTVPSAPVLTAPGPVGNFSTRTGG